MLGLSTKWNHIIQAHKAINLRIPSNFAMDQVTCLIVAQRCAMFLLEQQAERQELFVVHGGLAANSVDD